MIKEAYILGNVGLAVFKENENWFTLDVKEPTKKRNIHSFDLNTLLLSGSEVVFLKGDKTEKGIQESLHLESNRQTALTKALQLMDNSIKRIKTKELIAEFLEELFENKEIYQFVDYRLFSIPTPQNFLPKDAAEIANELSLKKTSQLFEQLEAQKDLISQFSVCWNKVNSNHHYFKSSEEVRSAFDVLADGGFIKEFVRSIFEGDKKVWDNALLNARLTLQKKGFGDNALLFTKILEEFKRSYGIAFEQKAKKRIEETDNVKDKIADMISKFLEEESETKTNQRFKKGDRSRRASKQRQRRDNYSDFEKVKGDVDYRLNEIIEKVKKRNTKGANDSLRELIKYQITVSNAGQICKTLCNLSAQLLSFNIEFAKKILSYAGQLNSNDEVVYNQNAEILKSEGNLNAAKEEYLKAKKNFPNDVVVQNGYAEILKSEGNLAEAKEEYLKIKEAFPSDIVAQNGYAEILKSEGNLAQAKEEYLKIKDSFPSDVFAQTGYAEILKSEGDLQAAKQEYLRINRTFPNETVAQAGYAEILKSEGDLNAAKEEYLRIKEAFPSDVVAQSGYAEILKSEGNLNAAKKEYQKIHKSFPYHTHAQHSLATIYFQLGDIKQFREILPIISTPLSEQDFYWHHLLIVDNIQSGNWEKAKKQLKHGLNTCQFYKTKQLYKRTLTYINIQTKEFSEALKGLGENQTAVDHLLNTHAFAATDQRELALKELNICKKFKEIKVIYDSACLLSERYAINGLPKKGYSEGKLDKLIQKKELDALITIF